MIGMGKLGGEELDLAADVDVIFARADARTIPIEEYVAKRARK